MKVALVGLGYWGPNLLRVLNKINVLAAAFDLDSEKVSKFATDPTYKNVYFDTDWKKCLGRSDIDAIFVATPPESHYGIALRSFKSKKHVFIEKPMTLDLTEAEKLVKISESKHRILMVGHTFLYVPEVMKVKEIIDSGELGDVVYIHASRLNLGKFQKANVVADLAPHDISIFNYLTDDKIDRVYANGYGFIDRNVVEVAKVTFEYKSGIVCDLHLSWLDPRKKRVTTVVGTKKMLVYNMLAEEKIKIYNKGVDIQDTIEHGNYMLAYRHGDVYSPYTEVWEPLELECRHFIECLENKQQPRTDGKNGVEAVRGLTAALKSLETGEWVCL